MLEIINYHCTEGSFNEVFVSWRLSFLYFEACNDFISFQKGHRLLFNWLKPHKHGTINIIRKTNNFYLLYFFIEYHFLLGNLKVSMCHDSVVDYFVWELKDVGVHSILFLKDCCTLRVFFTKLFEERYTHSFLLC